MVDIIKRKDPKYYKCKGIEYYILEYLNKIV